MIHTTSQSGAYPTHFSNGSVKAIADAPLEKGGQGTGFGPHELLEAALATCINMAVRMRADKSGIPLESVSTTVRLDRSQSDCVVFHYESHYEGALSSQDRDQLDEAANTCPVRTTLSKNIEFTPVVASVLPGG